MWIRDPARALRTALSPRRLIYNLLSLIVVFSMLAVAEAAWSAEQHHQRVELLVEHVRLSETQLGSYLWQTVAENSAQQGSTTKVQSAAGDPLALSPVQLYAQISQSVAALREADNSPSTLAIADAAQQLHTVGIKLLPMLAGGTDSRRAVDTANTELMPVLTRLDQATAVAYDEQAAVAQLSGKHASWVYSGTLIAGLFLLLILGARLSRLRHKSALVEERRVVEVRAERRLRGLIEHSSDIILVVNSDLTVRWQSSSAQRTLGYGGASLVGQRVTSLVHEDDTAAIEEALHALPKRGGTARLTVRFKAHNGISSHYEVIADDRLQDRDVEGLVLSMRDVTERMALEDELRHQAFHDSLTGLANRALFEDRLIHTLAGATVDERLVAVLFLDLDNFKTINDSLGHVHGDELLRAVAKRIGKSVGGSDTAARLGGDEFAVLIGPRPCVDPPGGADPALQPLRP
jgi:PAS domain S-box-containing protein